MLKRALSTIFGIPHAGDHFAATSRVFNGPADAQPPTLKISGQNPLRDESIGFLNNRELRLNLTNHIKKNLSDNSNYIIALDAQNLSSLNEAVGTETANKIWKLYTTEYIKALTEAFPNANAISGFRNIGDEAQIIISGKNITESKIEKAFEKAERKLQKQLSGTGISQLPSKDSKRSSGFALHHAIRSLAAFKEQDEEQTTAIRDHEDGLIHSQMLDFYLIPELAPLMTALNQNKEESANTNAEQLTNSEFASQYGAAISEMLDEIEPEDPHFIIPRELGDDLAGERDIDLTRQKHKDFIEQARPNTMLLRFDLTGMKLLNKALHSVEVESILGNLHQELVGRHFKIMSGTYGIDFVSFEPQSGVIDVLIDAQAWEDRKGESIGHINSLLERIYDFHLLADHHHTWDRIGHPYYSARTEEQRRAVLIENAPDQKIELLGRLEKELQYAQTPVIEGDSESTLRNIDEALKSSKVQKLSTASSVQYSSNRPTTAKRKP